MRAHDFGERQVRVIEGILRMDDALLGCIVKRLRLLDVAARADPGLLASSRLVEECTECITLTAIGGELIGGR
jgi:hypothetical protein